jgi:hypothetical protein
MSVCSAPSNLFVLDTDAYLKKQVKECLDIHQKSDFDYMALVNAENIENAACAKLIADYDTNIAIAYAKVKVAKDATIAGRVDNAMKLRAYNTASAVLNEFTVLKMAALAV